MKEKSIIPWISKLAVSILICLSAGAIGSIFTVSSVSGWYRTLEKPSFTPPDSLFGPVWTILYIFMGLSLFFAWSFPASNEKDKRWSMIVFGIQLILNILWSFAFFGLRNPPAAFFIIILLIFFIILNMLLFRKISSLSAYLMAPYLLWVCFAAVLNYSIIVMNRLF